MNQQSAFLDASHVYGTGPVEHETLRDPKGRHLLLLVQGERLLPPSLRPERDGCSDPDTARFCFRAGDGRVNQQPAIAVLQVSGPPSLSAAWTNASTGDGGRKHGVRKAKRSSKASH